MFTIQINNKDKTKLIIEYLIFQDGKIWNFKGFFHECSDEHSFTEYTKKTNSENAFLFLEDVWYIQLNLVNNLPFNLQICNISIR